MKKTLTIIVSLLLLITASTNVFANEMKINDLNLEEAREINDSNFINSLNELKVDVENNKITDRIQLNTLTENFRKSEVLSENPTPPENTNPNDSEYLAPNTGKQAEIKQEGEFRWYVTSVEEKTKLTNLLHLGSSEDFDLYLFKYNQEESKLDLINLSKNAAGEYEQIDQVIEKGIYFIAVHGKVGTGQFVLRFFASTLDVNYETNNTVPTATPITNSGRVLTIRGIIDNPTDVDVYKLEVTNEEISKVELISPTGKQYELTYYNGEKLLKIPEYYLFKPGTHYFIINSPNGGYSQTDQYTLRKTILDDKGINSRLIYKTPDNKYWLHRRANDKFYINEKAISFEYEYKHEFSDPRSNTHSRATMFVKEKPDTFFNVKSISYGSYETTFPTNTKYNDAIKLNVHEINGFIWRTSSGAHAGPHMKLSFDIAEVVLDPKTGKVVDLVNPNYYYIYTNHKYTFTPRN